MKLKTNIQVLLLVLLGWINGCGSADRDYELNEQSFTAKAKTMVEQETGIILPPGSRGLDFFYQGSSIDPSFIAKIQIPNGAKEEFSERIEQLPKRDGSVVNSLTKRVTWWKPTTANVERLFDRNMNCVHLILCEENSHCMLYVEWIKI